MFNVLSKTLAGGVLLLCRETGDPNRYNSYGSYIVDFLAFLKSYFWQYSEALQIWLPWKQYLKWRNHPNFIFEASMLHISDSVWYFGPFHGKGLWNKLYLLKIHISIIYSMNFKADVYLVQANRLYDTIISSGMCIHSVVDNMTDCNI